GDAQASPSFCTLDRLSSWSPESVSCTPDRARFLSSGDLRTGAKRLLFFLEQRLLFGTIPREALDAQFHFGKEPRALFQLGRGIFDVLPDGVIGLGKFFQLDPQRFDLAYDGFRTLPHLHTPEADHDGLQVCVE